MGVSPGIVEPYPSPQTNHTTSGCVNRFNFLPIPRSPRPQPEHDGSTTHVTMKRVMKVRKLERMGIPPAFARLAKSLVSAARASGQSENEVRQRLEVIVADPEAYREDEWFHALATVLARRRQALANLDRPLERTEPAPWRQWGKDLDAEAIKQMENACCLPISVQGALMPDAHLGYGLPIGGVLATGNAVIPYAVGVDIACRMKLSVLDLPVKALQSQHDRLINAIETETRFGMGGHFGPGRGGRGRRDRQRTHPVMDEDWRITTVTAGLKDKAHAQLGTSGSGNHFVEFGHFTVDDRAAGELGLPEPGAGVYLALLSHSGSRGPGSQVAGHYSRLAMDLHPELSKPLRHLAWLDLDTEEGQDYWNAMQLMGKFAAANHALIHHHLTRHIGARVLLDIENHHNFAWKQEHAGRDVVVHRKGATPAHPGVLGIIPGSMSAPAYVVRGKGSESSLHSASHGAGRVMSRRQAKRTYRWPQVRDHLEQRGVELISAGLDEVPFVYKDIDTVMSEQEDLVEIMARFDPKLVKMAPEGERAED